MEVPQPYNNPLNENNFLLDIADEFADETLICPNLAKISLTKNFKVNLTSKVRVNLKKLSNWRNFPFCVSPSDSFHSHDFEVLKSFGVTPGFGDQLK